MSLSLYRKNVHTYVPVDFFSEKKKLHLSHKRTSIKKIIRTNKTIIFYDYSTITSTLYISSPFDITLMSYCSCSESHCNCNFPIIIIGGSRSMYDWCCSVNANVVVFRHPTRDDINSKCFTLICLLICLIYRCECLEVLI